MLGIRRIGVAGLALSCVWMVGCVIRPYHRVYVGPGPAVVEPGPVVVDVAPPPPHVEVVPAIPGPGYMWLPGYWYWQGGRLCSGCNA